MMIRKKSEIHFFRHSGEGRNPEQMIRIGPAGYVGCCWKGKYPKAIFGPNHPPHAEPVEADRHGW
jgi:hypothetical protein